MTNRVRRLPIGWLSIRSMFSLDIAVKGLFVRLPASVKDVCGVAVTLMGPGIEE